MIELIIMCYYFQRRLSWMLSSILQQVDNPRDIIINLSAVPSNGSPSTEEVIEEFRSRGMIINVMWVTRDDIAYRGVLRDRQLQVLSSDTEWVYFADTDSVYPTNFFKELDYILSQPNNFNKCIASPYRYNTRVDETNIMLANSPLYIYSPFTKALDVTIIEPYSNRLVAAGNMQVVKKDIIKEKTGGRYYINDVSHDKHMFNSGMGTRSDMYFRQYFPNLILELPYQIHLDHNRYRRYDSVEEQR
jgi:hypothetical protein